MKIEYDLVPEMTLEKFAEKHGLVMQVNERPAYVNPKPGNNFYAQFKGSEVKDGNILKGAYANGSTPEEAIANYPQEISEELLVIDAYQLCRREIRVPRLTHNALNKE